MGRKKRAPAPASKAKLSKLHDTTKKRALERKTNAP